MLRQAKKLSKSTNTNSKTKVKRVYFFGNGKAEGRADMKDLLGGKGANLADMTAPVCPSRRASRSPPTPAATTTTPARSSPPA